MKLSCKRARRQQQTSNCSENVKSTHKSAQARPRTAARVYTPYHEKLRHVAKHQFGLGNFVRPTFISPVIGDLIEFDRKLYSHWAVYIGEGQQVIHVSGEKADIAHKNVQVRQSTLIEVAKGSLVRINNKVVPAKDRNLVALEPKKIVANAKKCLGMIVQQDMLTNNSEHYVTMWRYGKAWSDEAETAIAVMNPNKRRLSSCASSSSNSEEDLTGNSSIGSITSIGSDESASKKSISTKRLSTTSIGTPVTLSSSPQSPSVLSDKDASFQNSLLAGLTAIFNNDKPATRRYVTLKNQTSESRKEQ